MTFDTNAFLIILTGALIAISCGFLGVFLLLRKMSMTGDAISHAVLPGIVIGFFVSGSQRSLEVIIGAGLLGILSTLMIDALRWDFVSQEANGIAPVRACVRACVPRMGRRP